MKRYVFLGFLVLFVGIGVFAQTIGGAKQEGAWIYALDTNGKTIATVANGSNFTLLSWGSDFVVIMENDNTVQSRNINGNILGRLNGSDYIGCAVSVTNGNTIVIKKKNGDTGTYDKNLKRR